MGLTKIKDDISRFSVEKGHIYEVILSTFSEDGRPTAAPMGIIFADDESLIVRPFKTSLTFQNLKAKGCGVANITSDPALFYATAFKWMEKNRETLLDRFERARSVDAPRIKGAEGYVEFAVERAVDENEDRGRFRCPIRMAEVGTGSVKPYCRSTFATIECVIHATRVHEYLSRGSTDRANRLTKLIEYYGDLVGRVSPASEYDQIIRELLAYVRGLWRENESSSQKSI